MDVKIVFLNGSLEEEVYIKQSPNFEIQIGRDPMLCEKFYTLMKNKFEMSMMESLTISLNFKSSSAPRTCVVKNWAMWYYRSLEAPLHKGAPTTLLIFIIIFKELGVFLRI